MISETTVAIPQPYVVFTRNALLLVVKAANIVQAAGLDIIAHPVTNY